MAEEPAAVSWAPRSPSKVSDSPGSSGSGSNGSSILERGSHMVKSGLRRIGVFSSSISLSSHQLARNSFALWDGNQWRAARASAETSSANAVGIDEADADDDAAGGMSRLEQAWIKKPYMIQAIQRYTD